MTGLVDWQGARAAIVAALILLGCATVPSTGNRRSETPAPRRAVDATAAMAPVLPAFTAAIREGDVTKVVQLLDANPEQIDLQVGSQGWTPLQRAIRYGHRKLVEELVRQGATVELADHYGWTPMHYAALNGREAAMAVLLEHRADQNKRANQGETPLHWAVNNNQLPTALMLVDHGAWLNALDDLGRTPLDIAVKMGHSTLQKVLRKEGGVTSQELADAYDWVGSQKTVSQMRAYRRLLYLTASPGKPTEAPERTGRDGSK